jgi:hypothetical protein
MPEIPPESHCHSSPVTRIRYESVLGPPARLHPRAQTGRLNLRGRVRELTRPPHIGHQVMQARITVSTRAVCAVRTNGGHCRRGWHTSASTYLFVSGSLDAQLGRFPLSLRRVSVAVVLGAQPSAN